MLPPIPTRLLYRNCEKCHIVNHYTKAFDRETSNDIGVRTYEYKIQYFCHSCCKTYTHFEFYYFPWVNRNTRHAASRMNLIWEIRALRLELMAVEMILLK